MTSTNNSTVDSLRDIVVRDAQQSALKWEAAIESDDGRDWEELAEECAAAYEVALESIDAGDLEEAEAKLQEANMLESKGGDNGDALHALEAVRAAMA